MNPHNQRSRSLTAPRIATSLVALATALAISSVSAPAQAQDVVVDRVYRPNKPLIVSGFLTFGIAYSISLAVGLTSNVDADRALFIPIAGPWIDLATRGRCPVSEAACNGETAAKAGLIVDGIFQAIGAVTMVSGFLWRHETTTVVHQHQVKLDWVAPWINGQGGGLTAIGRF